MSGQLTNQVQDLAIAFIYAVVLIGSVGFALWSSLNLTTRAVWNTTNATPFISEYVSVLDTTQLLAWGLMLTFMCLGIAFGFMSYMRKGTASR